MSTKRSICQYCGRTIGDGDVGVREHLVTTIDNHNHIHVHGPLSNKVVLEEMVDAICSHGEIANPTCKPPTAITEVSKVPDKICLHNRQAIGDILTMTCLHYNSLVLLANGKAERIGKIVNNKMDVEVMSYNTKTNKFESKRVINWIKHKYDQSDWFFITYENARNSLCSKRQRGVFLTGDHEVLTDRGMVRIDQLTKKDRILTKEKSLNGAQIKAFTGAILGDGHLRKKTDVRRSRFTYGNTISQSEFVQLKNKVFNGLEYSQYIRTPKQDQKRKNQLHTEYYTNTEFNKLRMKWYPKGIKIIPKDLNEDDFSLLTLAIWYLDDGYLTKTAAGLCTQCFTKEENKKLCKILKRAFNLDATFRWTHGGNQTTLYIGNKSNKSADRFFTLIAPFIPNSMRYKLPPKFRDVPFDKNLWDTGVTNGYYYASPIVIKKAPPKNSVNNYVYCLEIEDNHNFISNNIVLSNCAVRDFKLAFPNTDIGVTTTALHVWDNNPYINWDLTYLTNKSNMWNYHMCNAFRMSLEQKMNFTIPQTHTRPDIWMTEEEYNRPPLIEGPYTIIIVGGEPGWGVKMYPADKWQEVIDTLKGEIQFVQLGVKSHPWAHLDNVIDYIGKTEDKNTGIRDLFNIFLHAQGSVGLVSMHMHLSAAFNNPCVVVAGAREPASFTHYFGHQYLQTNGCLPCAEKTACWKCKFEGCMEVQKRSGMEPQDVIPPCIDIIKPQEIVTAICKYYDGGRLKYGKKIPNTFFKNIVKEPNVYVAGEPIQVEIKPIDDIQLRFGGADITEKDWMFIENLISTTKFSTVLQFGLGITTSLFMKYCDKVVIYETNKNHELLEEYNRVKDLHKLEFRFWDGKTIAEDLAEFDLGFIDGPPGGGSREFSTKIASEHAKIILIHDENRKEERTWRDKYIKDSFIFKQKGGNRCAVWEKSGGEKIPEIRINLVPTTKIVDRKQNIPKVRLISTARGWGGCARSITTIMKFLIDAGHRVEFVPFHSKYELGKGIGGDFSRCLATTLKEVVVRDWSAITEPTEVLLTYSDDYVWEFKNPDLGNLFEKVQADRKLMFINYRLGEVGKIPWTQGWDEYGALNSGIIEKILQVYPDAKKTSVMPPCVNLTPFLESGSPIQYDGLLKLVRLSSQGNAKFYSNPDDWYNEIEAIKKVRKGVQFHFMPGPDYAIADGEYIFKYPKNNPPVPEFLRKGNLFWYSLPNNPKYFDMGPRTILESMASGLSCIADNWGGAVDRITPETGWLCDTKEEYVDIIETLTPEILREKGEAARQRAIDYWSPEKWINYILGK